MSVITSENNLNLTFLCNDSTGEGEAYLKLQLPNPASSSTIRNQISILNNSLAGGLSGAWTSNDTNYWKVKRVTKATIKEKHTVKDVLYPRN